MTDSEYHAWEKYHFAALPSVGAWITARPDTRPHWLRALASLDLEDAKAATDAMLADTSGEYERVFDNTPQVIRKLATGFAKRRRAAASFDKLVTDEGQLSYRCTACYDTGWVTVLTEPGVMFVRSWGDHEPPSKWIAMLNAYSNCVRCNCMNRPAAVAKRGEHLGFTYSPDNHCRHSGLDWKTMADWVRRKDRVAVASTEDSCEQDLFDDTW